jgi:hypothetical protein
MTILPLSSISIALILVGYVGPPIILGKVVLKQLGSGITASPEPSLLDVTLPTY